MTDPVMKFETHWADQMVVHFDEAEAQAHLLRVKQKSEEDRFFFMSLLAAEYHWHFVQGMEAIRRALFIPGVSSLLNGLEASLRFTLKQLTGPDAFEQEPSPYRVLSNRLLRDAAAQGMPVGNLAFPSEKDFFGTIVADKGPSAEIVRVRNQICHGNIYEFIEEVAEAECRIFTPDALRPLALNLLGMSARWAYALGNFRIERKLRAAPPPAIPPIPASLAGL